MSNYESTVQALSRKLYPNTDSGFKITNKLITFGKRVPYRIGFSLSNHESLSDRVKQNQKDQYMTSIYMSDLLSFKFWITLYEQLTEDKFWLTLIKKLRESKN